jgi:hypothetical protein
MKLKNTDKLEIVDRKLKVNGKTFFVQYPDEPLWRMEDGKLVTIVFKACGYTDNQWEPEENEGYFSDQKADVNSLKKNGISIV